MQNNSFINSILFTEKPFIGSFVNEIKNNDLTLWRMYGKEALEEAKGCAITIDIEKLKENIIEGLNISKDLDIPIDFEEIEFYNVAYLERNKFKFSGAEESELEILNKVMNELEFEILDLNKELNENSEEKLKIIELVNEIAYLFKSAEYKYENEVRLVIKKAVGFKKIINETFLPPKVYIELASITSSIKEITIGPKVERAEEWASAFHYSLNDKGYNAKISISTLPFK